MTHYTDVFVYGTLKRGHGNYRYFLKDNSPLALNDEPAQFLGQDTLSGFRMFSLGGFPAIKRDANSPYKVKGEVFRVGPKRLEQVDGLEGHPNFYKRTKVKTDSGKEVSVYVLVRDCTDYPEVGSGEW